MNDLQSQSNEQQGAEITIRWAQVATPKGEVREGFWVLDHGTPVHDKACFTTKQEAEEWVRHFNWF